MAKWKVRKYVWGAWASGPNKGKRTIVEEVIEADNVHQVDGALHFVWAYTKLDQPVIEAIRSRDEWFSVDRVEDQQEATIEPATRMELAGASDWQKAEGRRVSHEVAMAPELA